MVGMVFGRQRIFLSPCHIRQPLHIGFTAFLLHHFRRSCLENHLLSGQIAVYRFNTAATVAIQPFQQRSLCFSVIPPHHLLYVLVRSRIDCSIVGLSHNIIKDAGADRQIIGNRRDIIVFYDLHRIIIKHNRQNDGYHHGYQQNTAYNLFL